MKLVAAFLSALVIFCFSHLARAEFAEGHKALTPGMSFGAGGLAVGIDFEYAADRTYGLGGYFRLYPEDDEKGKEDLGLTAFGAFIRPHFNRQNWDFYVSPGFGFMSFEPGVSGQSDKHLIGPSLGMGLLYELTPVYAVGFDHTNFYGWFGDDDFHGLRFEEMLAQFRFIF